MGGKAKKQKVSCGEYELMMFLTLPCWRRSPLEEQRGAWRSPVTSSPRSQRGLTLLRLGFVPNMRRRPQREGKQLRGKDAAHASSSFSQPFISFVLIGHFTTSEVRDEDEHLHHWNSTFEENESCYFTSLQFIEIQHSLYCFCVFLFPFLFGWLPPHLNVQLIQELNAMKWFLFFCTFYTAFKNTFPIETHWNCFSFFINIILLIHFGFVLLLV